MSPLFLASLRSATRAGLAAPLGAALLLVVVCAQWFGGGHDLELLRCVAFLLTAAVVSAVDDPAAETLAAAPYTLAARTLGRIVVATFAAAAVWAVALAVAATTAPGVPLLGISLQGLGIAVIGVTCAAGLRRFGQLHEPAVIAIPLVLALLLAAQIIPRQWALLGDQTWGTTWIAAQVRWSAVVAFGVGVTACALADTR